MLRRFINTLRNWFRATPAVDDQEIGESIVPVETTTGTDEATSSTPVTTLSDPAQPIPTAQETAAAQSILENESLTADLDDTAANALLEWGVANARMIARNMMTLFDDPAADSTTEERLRALRGMMRSVNQYTAGTETDESALEKILQQAATVYGDTFATPSAEARATFLRNQTTLIHNPAQMITNLRRFIEEQIVSSNR
jgi:hypothetical protein